MKFFNFLTNREWFYQSLVGNEFYDWLVEEEKRKSNNYVSHQEDDTPFSILYEFYQNVGDIAYRARKQGQSGYKIAIDQIIELVDKVS